MKKILGSIGILLIIQLMIFVIALFFSNGNIKTSFIFSCFCVGIVSTILIAFCLIFWICKKYLITHDNKRPKRFDMKGLCNSCKHPIKTINWMDKYLGDREIKKMKKMYDDDFHKKSMQCYDFVFNYGRLGYPLMCTGWYFINDDLKIMFFGFNCSVEQAKQNIINCMKIYDWSPLCEEKLIEMLK